MSTSPWIGLFGDARVVIFAGHYGSGKSEIAVAYANQMAKAGKHVLLADMDIVNPFFRSLDARVMLETTGVRVVAPLYANTNVDVPALVPEVTTALHNPELLVVLDVGGDGDGARVLGRYHRDIEKTELAMAFVFNASRPLTRTAEAAAGQMEEISFASRQRFTHILNNTHLMDDTSEDIVQAGEGEALRLSGLSGCPLAGTIVAESVDGGMAGPAAATVRRLPLVRVLGTPFR